LILIALTAVPYGTSEPWWKLFFASLMFLLAAAWLVDGLLSGSWKTAGTPVLLPLIALSAFALFQTLSFPNRGSSWIAISADPYQTRIFALQLMALTIAGALFYRYAGTRARINTLIYVIIFVAVASAIFGLIRQTTQHAAGFGLPRLQTDSGYGQFINKNHFAFLMEMAFGLGVGLIVAGGITRERALIYFASLLPIWTALVFSNSRGGMLAMMAQLVIAALLFTSASDTANRGTGRVVEILRSWPVRIALMAVLILGVFIGTVWVGGDRLASNLEAVRIEFNDETAATRHGANRNEIWKATLRMFQAHPIAGAGMGGYWVAITAYHDASGRLTPQEAHNDYLELLASGGLIGIAIGGWFIFVVWKRISRNLLSRDRFTRAVTFAATLGIAGVAIHSLVDFGLHMIVNALIFIALITIATRETGVSEL
jgi:O-antigen ligase